MLRQADGRQRTRSVRAAVALLGLTAALVLGTLPTGSARTWQAESDAQEADAGPVVGLGEPGEVAFAFVGRIERRAQSTTIYGYLTDIAGLSPEDLYVDPAAPSAETARFTLVGSGDPLPSVAVDDVEVATSAGEIWINYNPGAGATFASAEAFFSGTRIAGGAARFNHVFLGDPGSPRTVDVFAVIELTESTPVVLESGDEVRFGQPEALLHLRATGSEPPAEEDATRTTTLAGRVLVAATPGQEASPPTPRQPPVRPTAANDEPTEEPSGSTGVDCQAAEAWLTGSLGRVARTRALVTPVVAIATDEATDPFAELEADGLRDAAAELNELADAQQAAEATADVEDADLLLVSAFQSFARGLNLLATAVANEDADALEEARALLAEATAALAQGSQPLADLARACDIGP